MNAAVPHSAFARLLRLPVTGDGWRARILGEYDLPDRWRGRLLHKAQRREVEAGLQASNYELRATCESLARSSIPLDATDSDVSRYADRFAREAMGVHAAFPRFAGDAWPWPCSGRGDSLRAALDRFCRARGIDPPLEDIEDQPAILRMRCPQFWRRRLRVMHARAVEASAISLGFVGKHADKYVSDESLLRRADQNARNARTLESTEAENEDGERMTLAQLAAKSPSQPAIRRGELVTRIKGFEVIAKAAGHAALFVTITCPSKMHATRNGQPNPKFDGTRPDEAQRYLCGVWARIRAECWRESGEKRATKFYGFRIVEPHADGCPHWHLILWAPDAEMYWIKRAISDHALAEDGDEAGADLARVKFEAIDPAKGSAVSYVIKYIAKNIDGFRVGDWRVDGDLLGDESINLSDRVTAWAATWRIRMFQQVAGPPVGVWRELRRVKREALAPIAGSKGASEVIGLPENAAAAWLAAQRFDIEHKGEGAEPVKVARLADWAGYVRALGGPLVRRNELAVILAKRPSLDLGRYGDLMAPRPCGVMALAHKVVDYGGIVGRIVVGHVNRLVESVRKVWRIVSGRGSEGARSATDSRTRVNNCTGAVDDRGRLAEVSNLSGVFQCVGVRDQSARRTSPGGPLAGDVRADVPPIAFVGPPLPVAVLQARYGVPEDQSRGWPWIH